MEKFRGVGVKTQTSSLGLLPGQGGAGFLFSEETGQLGLGCSSEALSSQLGFGAVAREGGCLWHEMLSHCKRNAFWLPPASVVPFLAAKQCGERANFLMLI